MKAHWFLAHLVVFAAAFGLVLPRPLVAVAAELNGSGSGFHAELVRDVALTRDGALFGLVVDGQGVPAAGVLVEVRRDRQLVTTAKTDPQGHFAVAQLTSGLYQLATPASATWWRVWARPVAPPAAKDIVLIVAGPAARGQGGPYYYPRRTRPGMGSGHYGGAIVRFLDRPWVAAGLVATGIAVPLALDDQDDAS